MRRVCTYAAIGTPIATVLVHDYIYCDIKTASIRENFPQNDGSKPSSPNIPENIGDYHTTSRFNYENRHGNIHVKFIGPKYKNNKYKYTYGNNYDHKEFRPYNACSSGGLYFTNLNNALDYKSFGPIVALVDLKDNLPIYCEDGKAKTPGFKIRKNRVYSRELFLECYSNDPEKLLECLDSRSTPLISKIRSSLNL